MPPAVKVMGQGICIAAYLVLSNAPWATWMVAGPLLVLTANAWNVIDVMDGLAGSVGLMCFVGAGMVLWLQGAATTALALVALSFAAALLGFLVWNRPPARIILGDAGSIPIGLLFGLLIVESWAARPAAGITVALTGVIPLFEVVFLIIERSRRRVPFYRSTPDHFALRLRRHGRSPQAILKGVLLCGGGVSILAATASAVAFHRWVLVLTCAFVLVGSLIAYRRLRVLSPETAP
jgi:UDP-GlcNAc:undecaprenyl-phosphate GlcNAc-1-phosphate transferase